MAIYEVGDTCVGQNFRELLRRSMDDMESKLVEKASEKLGPVLNGDYTEQIRTAISEIVEAERVRVAQIVDRSEKEFISYMEDHGKTRYNDGAYDERDKSYRAHQKDIRLHTRAARAKLMDDVLLLAPEVLKFDHRNDDENTWKVKQRLVAELTPTQ